MSDDKAIWVLRSKEHGRRVTYFSNDGPPSPAYVKYVPQSDTTCGFCDFDRSAEKRIKELEEIIESKSRVTK